MLGDMVRAELPDSGPRPVVCTKFAALPWRVGRGAVVDAMKASLDRLGMDSVDAYMIHWPGVWQNDAYAEGARNRKRGTSREGFWLGVCKSALDQRPKVLLRW